MSIGVYKLNFIGTDKVYVGQSINIERRFLEHIRSLKNNKANYKLKEAYVLYGKPSLEILEICELFDLNTTENGYIKIFNSVNNGFNILDTASIGVLHQQGEKHPNSIYSNEKIVEVFNLLVKSNPIIDIKQIHIITGVTISTIQQIAILRSHTWLKNEYPEKYFLLEDIKRLGKRKSTSIINKTAKDRGIEYPNIISPEGVIYSNIENITKFAREHNLDQSNLTNVLNKRRRIHKGWKLVGGT